MSKFIKPARLHQGDTVAVLSPSSGAAARFPHIQENGIKNLKEIFGLNVKEYPTSKADSLFLYKNPQKRAEDLNNAFADKEVKAIISNIGGDESVRILKYLDKETIQANPKIIMGLSDATTYLSYICQMGLVTFYGPAMMTGLSQLKSLPEAYSHEISDMFFQPKDQYLYKEYPSYSYGYPEWAEKENTGKIKPPQSHEGWRWLQGEKKARGTLFGGCIEVLEFMNGTEFWPKPGFWRGKILFLETSEEKPTPTDVKRMIRNYGVQNILDKINGLMIATPMFYSDSEKAELDKAVIEVVAGEFGRADIPIVSNVLFGHPEPRHIMPSGIRAELNPKKGTIKLLEPAVT
jgi:muramoyltetrapeptide carboxypeptidase LdcA involved in peptidoglycan recycling